MKRIVSFGEILWDVIEGDEHLGGAPLNFSAHASRLGHDVRVVSALGEDDCGRRARVKIRELGLSDSYIRTVADRETGIVSVRMEAAGQPHFTIHRPAAYDLPELNSAQLDELATWAPDWFYYGTLTQTSARCKHLLNEIMARTPRARRFYDVNLRAGNYTPALIAELLALASVVKLNDDEVRAVSEATETGFETIELFCRNLCRKFGCEAVCVTRGAAGCALLDGENYVESPGYRVDVADSVGAGDAFSAALVHGLSESWPTVKITDFCNRVGALVASRHGAIPQWTLEECLGLS